MSLASVIAADVTAVFFNTDDFAVSITYTRALESVELTAIVEPSRFEMFTELGATRVERRGYLIKASTLNFGSGVTLPQIGDTITEGSNVYIVPKGTELPRYEYTDEDRLILRVNTTLQSGT